MFSSYDLQKEINDKHVDYYFMLPRLFPFPGKHFEDDRGKLHCSTIQDILPPSKKDKKR